MAFAFYAKKFDPELPLEYNDISMNNSLITAFNHSDKQLADMFETLKDEEAELRIKLELQDEMIREQKRDIEWLKHGASFDYHDEERKMNELEMQYEEGQRCAKCWIDEWYDSKDEEQEYTKQEIMNARAVLTAKGIKF
jgi:hypothetical protein